MSLVAPFGGESTSLAALLMIGMKPYSLNPIFATLVFSGIFAVASIWRFRREEF